jgi:ubiquinone/menaquinone biosynthesis C-methylase UbiE
MRRSEGLDRAHVTRANVAYHDRLAETYDDRLGLFHPHVVAHMERLLEEDVFSRIPEPRTARVLDLGCGTGYLEQFLVGRFEDITGVEVSGGMLEIARRKYPGVRFVQRDVYEFEIEPEGYDVILENALFHHLRDYDEIFERMIGGVRPGGVLFLGCEPNAFAHRLLAPLRSAYRALLPERRVEEVVRGFEDQPASPSGGCAGSAAETLEEIVEYHQRGGLSPGRFAQRLRARGFDEIRVVYPTICFLAHLQDTTRIPFPALLPFARLGRLTPDFHLVGRRAR